MGQMRLLHSPAYFHIVYGKRNNKAQSSLEYAVVIICLVAALLAMQVYIKRGIQGRLRAVADELGQQYSPKNTSGTSTLTSNSNTTTIVSTTESTTEPGVFSTETFAVLGTPEDLNGDGKITPDEIIGPSAEITGGATTTQTSDETVGNLESSLF